MVGRIIFGDNLAVLATLPSASFSLIYIDPPFNTGHVQRRQQLQTTQSATGDRVGYAGKTYETEVVSERAYADQFDDYLGFLRPRLERARELLTADGSLYFHIDYREVHYWCY